MALRRLCTSSDGLLPFTDRTWAGSQHVNGLLLREDRRNLLYVLCRDWQLASRVTGGRKLLASPWLNSGDRCDLSPPMQHRAERQERNKYV